MQQCFLLIMLKILDDLHLLLTSGDYEERQQMESQEYGGLILKLLRVLLQFNVVYFGEADCILRIADTRLQFDQ